MWRFKKLLRYHIRNNDVWDIVQKRSFEGQKEFLAKMDRNKTLVELFAFIRKYFVASDYPIESHMNCHEEISKVNCPSLHIQALDDPIMCDEGTDY